VNWNNSLSAPTPQEQVEQIWTGTRAEWRGEGRGGGRRAEEGMGAEENGDVNDNFLFQASI